MIKRLWIRFTNKPLYGAILEVDRLMEKIEKNKKDHKKTSDLYKQLYYLKARCELLKIKK